MKTTNKLFSILTLLALVLSLTSLQAVHAAGSITVNSNADDTLANLDLNSTCDLREAITNANNDAQTYTDCATGSGTDTITFADNYTITLGSQLPAVISPIIINGNGAANTILRASSCNPITLVDDDTLASGCSPATYRVFAVDNTGNLTLDGLTVRNGNSSNYGGGISNAGALTVSNVTFSTNSAINGGGGLYNESGSNATLTDVTFSGNSAGYGGGMQNNSVATLTLNGVTFSDNSAVSGSGGGMFNYKSNLTLTSVTFSTNHADSGSGGGMYNSNSSSPTLTNVTFSTNSAINGGGMYNADSSPTLTNVAFSGNSVTSTGSGGGMYNWFSNPTLTNVTFSDNFTGSGGKGGGMYGTNSSATLTNVTFSGNSAPSGFGGGMSNYNSTSPTLTNVTFSGNSAVSGSGGGMFNYNNSNPTLTNTIIANSTSGGDCVNGMGSILNAASSNNLIEDGSNACGLTDGVNDNIIGSDPILEVLANNGGSTKTHALRTGSLAINAGTNTGCPATDQRGVNRDSSCDIGAFEYVVYKLFLSLILR